MLLAVLELILPDVVVIARYFIRSGHRPPVISFHPRVVEPLEGEGAALLQVCKTRFEQGIQFCDGLHGFIGTDVGHRSIPTGALHGLE